MKEVLIDRSQLVFEDHVQVSYHSWIALHVRGLVRGGAKDGRPSSTSARQQGKRLKEKSTRR